MNRTTKEAVDILQRLKSACKHRKVQPWPSDAAPKASNAAVLKATYILIDIGYGGPQARWPEIIEEAIKRLEEGR